MTTLECILIIILYIVIGIITGVKLPRDWWEETPIAVLTSIFWPIAWIVRFIQTFFIEDWDW